MLGGQGWTHRECVASAWVFRQDVQLVAASLCIIGHQHCIISWIVGQGAGGSIHSGGTVPAKV